MRITKQGRRVAGRWALLLAVGGGLAAGGWLAAGRPATGGTGGTGPADRPAQAAPEGLGPAAPTRIRIPRIGVDAPVAGVGLDGQGHLEPPSGTDRNLAGWYRGGVSPGQTGTAVLLGHVDTRQGPAVFRRLGSLHRGDLIDITRSDRHTARFAVDAVGADAKSAFPGDRAHAAPADARLRLITCDGDSPQAHGDVVVYAHLAQTD